MLKSVAVVLLFAGGMGGPVVAFCLTEAKSVWVFAAFTGIVAVVAAVTIDDRRGVPPIWWMVGAERPARDPLDPPLWRCIAEPLAIWASIFAVLYVVGTLVHQAVG
jgi:hypothetical protein